MAVQGRFRQVAPRTGSQIEPEMGRGEGSALADGLRLGQQAYGPGRGVADGLGDALSGRSPGGRVFQPAFCRSSRIAEPRSGQAPTTAGLGKWGRPSALPPNRYGLCLLRERT